MTRAKLDNTPTVPPIAVVGMAGRFPGADSVSQFWDNLVAGRSGVTPVGDTRARGSKLPDELNYVDKSAVVKDADLFDAQFFGIIPKQAQEMDPQHRLFLQTCWHALEDAGYSPDETTCRVGVYAGCHMNTYIFQRLSEDAELRESLADTFPGGSLTAEISNDKDYLATRVAFHLNLRGPSVAVQTACSTSLVAIAQACSSLVAGDCEMALAGGVTVTFPQEQGYLHTEDSILSPDGTCRTFDANAKGTIFGDGVGAVVLKRLDDAVRDRDDIYAVIKGWGVSNDGSDKGGYTAPSVDGQAAAIRQAHQRANITADTISYVEAHGTGTLVGDPIEIEALTKAFRETTDKKQFCRIASLKTNVGHLDVAAGVTGAIKTCLCLKHKQLPPLLNYDTPNPRIDFENSPFVVNDTLVDWDNAPLPRRAGISSFGVGGTNAHLVFEEAPPLEREESRKPHHVINLSARSVTALDAMTDELANYLETVQDCPTANLADICATLQTGRKSFQHKRTLVANDFADAIRLLRERPSTECWTSSQRKANTETVFMFPGQGSQHFGMARELYESEPVFAVAVDACAELLQPHLNIDLRQLLFVDADRAAECLDQTSFAQPSIFMISYATAQWLLAMGVHPSLMLGHSVGEFAAATVAGVMSLADGAKLVATRGKLMQALPPGSMLAVRLSEADVAPLLSKSSTNLEIAAINSPEMCVVSGTSNEVEQFANELTTGKYGDPIAVTQLRTSHAFHSRMMDPAVEQFRKVLDSVELAAPTMPIVSTVTAKPMSDAQATDRDYWARQIREPVRFSDSLQGLLDDGRKVLLEVGPHQALSALARLQSLDANKHQVLPTLQHAKQSISSAKHATQTLGRLWLAGVAVRWPSFYGDEPRTRVHLPTYRFEPKRHWFTVSRPSTQTESPTTTTSSNDQPLAELPSAPVHSNGAPLQPQPVGAAAGLPNSAAVEYSGSQPQGSADFRAQLIEHQLQMLQQQNELLRRSHQR